MRIVKAVATSVYVCLAIVPLLPFALVMLAGDWIANWNWPQRYLDAVKTFGERIGLDKV